MNINILLMIFKLDLNLGRYFPFDTHVWRVTALMGSGRGKWIFFPFVLLPTLDPKMTDGWKALELHWVKKYILSTNVKTVITKPQKSQMPGSLGFQWCSAELLKLMPEKGRETLCRWSSRCHMAHKNDRLQWHFQLIDALIFPLYI